MNPQQNVPCPLCRDTGRVERPATVDHILTDTTPWGPCPNGCPPLSDAAMRVISYAMLGTIFNERHGR